MRTKKKKPSDGVDVYEARYCLRTDMRWTAALVLDGEPVEGVETVDGATIETARRKINAVARRRFVGQEFEVLDCFDLPEEEARLVTIVSTARDESYIAEMMYRHAMAVAAKSLRDAGLSTRDSAEILGVSQQRVLQILKAEE